MNSSTIRGAILVTKAAYDKYANYRDRKTREAYDALLNAADSYDDIHKDVKANVTEFYDQSQERVSSLTEQARKRLDSAIADAAAAKDNTVKTVNKKSKKAQKAARKAAKSAKKSAAPKKQPSFGKRLFNFSVFTTILATIGAVAYYFLSKRDVVSTEPPHVEDFGADSVNTEESRLVYSTQTPVDDEEEHVSSPEEGATERDEKLLGSLEDQLRQHTDSKDTK